MDHVPRSKAGLLHHRRRSRLHLPLRYSDVHLWKEVQELDEQGQSFSGGDESVVCALIKNTIAGPLFLSRARLWRLESHASHQLFASCLPRVKTAMISDVAVHASPKSEKIVNKSAQAFFTQRSHLQLVAWKASTYAGTTLL